MLLLLLQGVVIVDARFGQGPLEERLDGDAGFDLLLDVLPIRRR